MSQLAPMAAPPAPAVPLPSPRWRQAVVASPAEGTGLIREVVAAMAAAGYPRRDEGAVRLALREALTNAVEHGHGGDATRPVTVRYRVDSHHVVAEVEDQGPGFNPRRVPDPRTSPHREQPGGRGLFLMRAYMNWVRHNRRGNCVTLCRHRSA